VKRITKDEVVVENGAGEKRLPARRVFALTGYHPDFTFIESLGVRLDPESRKPALDPNTLESNVAESIWREWLSAGAILARFSSKTGASMGSRSFKHWRCERQGSDRGQICPPEAVC